QAAERRLRRKLRHRRRAITQPRHSPPPLLPSSLAPRLPSYSIQLRLGHITVLFHLAAYAIGKSPDDRLDLARADALEAVAREAEQLQLDADRPGARRFASSGKKSRKIRCRVNHFVGRNRRCWDIVFATHRGLSVGNRSWGRLPVATTWIEVCF